MRISDAKSAANAYSIMAQLGLASQVPTDANDITRRFGRVTGRNKAMAAALNSFVAEKGFEVLAAAVRERRTGRKSGAIPSHEVSEAAATLSCPSFGADDSNSPPLAAMAGLY